MELLEDLFRRLEQLNDIGAALSSERDIERLLEKILEAAKAITHADAGTLYRVSADGRALRFEIVRNDTLGIALGGTTGKAIDFPPVPLTDDAGAPNLAMVAAYCAARRETVNIADAYEAEGFDFSGTRKFDARTGYRSKSFLTVPMTNHENEVIGVLQLINRRERAGGGVLPFDKSDRKLAESLASQAAIALTNRQLIQQLEELFESFIRLINLAIDEKSPYTGGHCERVPVLTMMLAEAVNHTREGPLAGFTMSEQERYELKIASLLHDCGKVTTPVHVVDKATKLQTIWDRMELIDTRVEVMKRDAEIAALKARLASREPPDPAAEQRIQAAYQQRLRDIDDDAAFLHRVSTGGEAMSAADQARVRAIAARYRWRAPQGREAPLLMRYRMLRDGSGSVQPIFDEAEAEAARRKAQADPAGLEIYDEVENLTIRSGTLTARERDIINYHIVATIKMLEALPWPRHLKHVPEFAGGHHERMDGRGYPRGLTRAQMSVQARMLGIADIFEALTAKDRPYKPGKTLSESLHILGGFKLDGHIDPDLFDVFVREKVYLRYAERFLDPAQIDAVDESRIPGYRP